MSKPKGTSDSAFSKFFRNATKKQREDLFREVAEKAIQEQRKVLDEVSEKGTHPGEQ